MENPGDRTVQISEMVEDRTSTFLEVEVPSLACEACLVPSGIVAAEALDSLVPYIPRSGNSNRVGKIPYSMDSGMIMELRQKYCIPYKVRLKKPMFFARADATEER